MALDIYIMPLTKFYSGDYTSPLEEMYGDRVVRMGSSKGELPSQEVQEMVSELQANLKKELKVNSTWQDEGESVGEQFSYEAYDALRAFAAHQEHPKTKGLFSKTPLDFNPSWNLQKHPGIKKVVRGASSKFQHLIQHANNQGFWFPFDFKSPINLNPDTGLFAGSSIRLKQELQEIRSLLQINKSWDEIQDGEAIADETDPLSAIKYACAVMLHYANLSCNKKLPIVFDG